MARQGPRRIWEAMIAPQMSGEEHIVGHGNRMELRLLFLLAPLRYPAPFDIKLRVFLV